MPPKRKAPPAAAAADPNERARSALELLADDLDASLADLRAERHRREELLDAWYRRPEVMQKLVDAPVWEAAKKDLVLLRPTHSRLDDGTDELVVRAQARGSDGLVSVRWRSSAPKVLDVEDYRGDEPPPLVPIREDAPLERIVATWPSGCVAEMAAWSLIRKYDREGGFAPHSYRDYEM